MSLLRVLFFWWKKRGITHCCSSLIRCSKGPLKGKRLMGAISLECTFTASQFRNLAPPETNSHPTRSIDSRRLNEHPASTLGGKASKNQKLPAPTAPGYGYRVLVRGSAKSWVGIWFGRQYNFPFGGPASSFVDGKRNRHLESS